MHNLHLRNIDDHLMLALKQSAAQQATSMNKCILALLKKSLEKASSRIKLRHDFDEFLGKYWLCAVGIPGHRGARGGVLSRRGWLKFGQAA